MATTTSGMRQGDYATVGRTAVQKATMIVGAIFLLMGILGFMPGITHNLDDITFASRDSQAELFGIFQVSVLHNVVCLLFGVIGLIAAKQYAASETYLIAGGAIYLLLWLYGVVVQQGSDANFVPVNNEENWLHLVLGVGMIALGYALTRDRYERQERH
jgi:arginine exporter protein ArgO